MVANLVRGKRVSDVLVQLDFVAKKASLPIKNLIASAVANAKAMDIPTDELVVKTIKVDGGSIMYRRRPAARGSAHPIRKRTSSVFVELSPLAESKKSKVIKEEMKTEKTKVIKSKKTKKSK